MKNTLKKITSICSVVVLLFSLVSCGTSEESERSKREGSSSPEAAMHSLVRGFYNGDVDEICKAAAPSEVWDYVCKETGLSKERVINRILQYDTVEEISKGLKSNLKESDINKVKIKEKGEGDDSYYHYFNEVMSNAGIEENIERIYIIDDGTPDFDFPDIWQGWAYEINGKWYFGEEFILEYLFNVVLDGYSALPEEKHYEDDEDDYYEYQQDTLPQKQDYENNANQEYNENTEHNSLSESVNLCADSSNWTSWSSEENGCAANLKILSNGAALEVTKADAGFYEGYELSYYIYFNQLGYNNIALEKGATYRWEFDYESSEDILFNFAVQQNYEPYSWYASYNDGISDVLSDVGNHYSIQFTMPEKDDNVTIVFNCNYPDAATPYTFTVKNLKLVRVS